jgi:hypothetical protein
MFKQPLARLLASHESVIKEKELSAAVLGWKTRMGRKFFYCIALTFIARSYMFLFSGDPKRQGATLIYDTSYSHFSLYKDVYLAPIRLASASSCKVSARFTRERKKFLSPSIYVHNSLFWERKAPNISFLKHFNCHLKRRRRIPNAVQRNHKFSSALTIFHLVFGACESFSCDDLFS